MKNPIVTWKKEKEKKNIIKSFSKSFVINIKFKIGYNAIATVVYLYSSLFFIVWKQIIILNDWWDGSISDNS